MTSTQLARSAGADPTWLFNTERLLGQRFPRTLAGSRNLALVRMLHSELGIDLAVAVGIVRARPGTGSNRGNLVREVGGAVALLIDPERFESVWLLNLAAALEMKPRLKGRPLASTTDPMSRARRYGIDVGLLEWQLLRSVSERLSELDRNSRFVTAGQR